MDTLTGLQFARPEALLLLLLLVPLTVLAARSSMAALRRLARRWSLGLRLAIIGLLVFALSGVSIVQASDRLSVVFLLDHSDSVGSEAREAQAAYVRAAIGGMTPNDAAGVVVFGSEALVDRPVLPEKAPPDLASAPSTSYSNIADALRLGLAVSPADTARRIVLLSDGKENFGSAETAARLASAYGVPVDVVTLPSVSGPEVWLDGLKAPSPVREGERVSLQIGVSSSVETTATLLVLMDGTPLNTQTVSLARGSNTFVQSVPPITKGFHTYSAQIIPREGSDSRGENNRYSAYSYALGKPRILIVEGQPGVGEPLKRALDAQIESDLIAAEAMPADAKSLVGYDGVALVNVPASSLSRKTMESLQVVVRDLGKGLIVVGGDESFAAGGYARTPLEAMLPLGLDMPSKIDIPSVGMALVLDRSGSMESPHAGNGSVKKLELAKEAAYQAVAQLNPKDYAGVVAFDDGANWVIELQAVADLEPFRTSIGGITSGGGTDIYSGLEPAVEALEKNNARRKHIILLTDGVSAGGDYDGLLKRMEAGEITLSSIAVGADADTGLLQTLATLGKGRFYYSEGDSLAQIFARETHLAARAYIIERPFTPERTSPSPILEGVGGLPPLQGYVGTSPRPSGQVVLVSDAGDPVLAQWQYGLGRVVAWTSDAKGQWARDWVAWEGFPRFWGQAVGWSTGAQAATALQPRVELEGERARIVVDAVSPDGTYLNDLSAGVIVVSPELVTETVELRQTSAGRYEGEFVAREEGAYLLQVSTEGKDGGKMTQTLGAVVPYSPEYRGVSNDNGLMARLASLTGGRALTLDNPAAPFEHNLSAVSSTTELWPLLLLLAVLLLPFDIGVRRLSFSRKDVSEALVGLREKLGLRGRMAPATTPAQASTPELATLFSAKGRARDGLDRAVDGAQTQTQAQPDPQAWARDLQLSGRAGRTTTPSAPASPMPPPPQPPGTAAQPPPPPPPAVEGETFASRLRRARDERK